MSHYYGTKHNNTVKKNNIGHIRYNYTIVANFCHPRALAYPQLQKRKRPFPCRYLKRYVGPTVRFVSWSDISEGCEGGNDAVIIVVVTTMPVTSLSTYNITTTVTTECYFNRLAVARPNRKLSSQFYPSLNPLLTSCARKASCLYRQLL